MNELGSMVFGARADEPSRRGRADARQPDWRPSSIEEDAWRLRGAEAGDRRSCTCVRPETAADRRCYERRVRAGTWLRPFRGLYVPTDEWKKLSAADRARVIVRESASVHPAWTYSLFSAAAMYGLEIGLGYVMPLHVNVTRRQQARSTAQVVRHLRPESDPVLVDGVRVTPPVQTVIDCLLELPFPRALAVADSALRVLELEKDELWAELGSRERTGRWGFARDAITHADARAENGGESVGRAVMLEQGFAVPDLQVKVGDQVDRDRAYFVDYFWDVQGVGRIAGELDGWDKYFDEELTGGKDVREVIADERRRESRLTAPGLRVFRFRYRDLADVGEFVKSLEAYGVPRGPARVMGLL